VAAGLGEVRPFSIPAEIAGPVSFRLLAIWAQREPTYIRHVLAEVASRGEWLRGDSGWIAGDLNTSPVLDRNGGDKHVQIVEAFRELGLTCAYHAHMDEAHGAESLPTYYHQWNRSKPFHIDYAFLPTDWAGRIRSVRVVELDPADRISDHMPLVVELN
jgi:endonuclease/exonuclease/phosphatase family metal-dependent hydrolase